MRFLNPEMANWFLIVPLAGVFVALHLRAKRRFRQRAGIESGLRNMSRLTPARRDIVSWVAALVGLVALVVALMRPQLLIEMRTPQYVGEDLVIVLDRSASMWATDVAPSRFARAVEEIRAFLIHKPDGIDRVGLVGFSGTSVILSHLTRDVNSLLFYLDWIVEDREPRFGTDIGSALESARELVRKDGKPTDKIFVVVSDGDNQGQIEAVTAALRRDRARVYSIGIGGNEPVEIPVSGGDEHGDLLTTRFDESTLRDIAEAGRGRCLRSAKGDELRAAMQDIVARERKLVGWRTSLDFRDLHRESLGAAAAAFLVLLLTL